MSKLEQHRRQLACQRSYIRKREEGLPPRSLGEYRVVVYEDFVAQYNYRGGKVQNLVFTIKLKDA